MSKREWILVDHWLIVAGDVYEMAEICDALKRANVNFTAEKAGEVKYHVRLHREMKQAFDHD